MHAHIAKVEGESLEYESTVAAVHLRVTRRDAKVGVGAFAEYEFSHHEEHADRIEVRPAVSMILGQSLLAFNLVADRHRGDEADTEWGYSAGFRRGASDRAAWGLEAQGSLEESVHEVLAAVYLDPTPRFSVNARIGTGAGDSEIDLSLRTALVWRIGRV